jgi:hypothetical protein
MGVLKMEDPAFDLGVDETVLDAALPGMVAAPADLPPFRSAKESAVSDWEKGYLTQLMQKAGGNLSLAARLAQVDRGHLRELLRHHQVGGRETAAVPVVALAAARSEAHRARASAGVSCTPSARR